MNIRLLFLPILALMPITNYSMMNKIKYYANPKSYNKMYCNWRHKAVYKDAPPELQEWWRKVQKNVGVKHPIKAKVMSETDKPIGKAYVLGKSMFINDNYFGDKSVTYGAKNHVLHHEGIHLAEDHDSKILEVARIHYTEYCTQMGLLVAGLYNLHTPFIELNSYIMMSASSLLIGALCASQVFAAQKMSFFNESEADIKGAYATGCHSCVNEAAVERTGTHAWSIQKMGYASAKKMRSIAEELKQQNQVCDYHRNGGLPK